MDRDNRWDRTEQAYRILVEGQGPAAPDLLALITASYQAGTTDEFILPHKHAAYHGMQDGDGLFMANFRADRVRQILFALLLPTFTHFPRPQPIRFAAALGLTPYSEALNPLIPPLFARQPVAQGLGELMAQHGHRQLRIAETEKYAHVTFFFNGGQETLLPGEDRLLVPSPAVSTYDLAPEMSAFPMTDKIVAAIESQDYSLIVLNYANTDMVGHTGVVPAILKAVETVDTCLGRLVAAVQKTGAALLITADHGNVEQVFDHAAGQPHTAHTCNPVPFILVNGPPMRLRPQGTLADVAPTILELMGIPIPSAMSGQSLVAGKHA
jgi:2,3-bisphosphoglycerate-independent phosphoglycerate mutase